MRITKALVGVSAFVLLSAILGIGQTTFGVISGSVTDSAGAVVAGATVTVQRADGGEPKVAKTGATGDYRVESLIPGTYVVKVSAEHFAQVELSNITVSASVTTPVNVKLSVGTTTEMVTVDASLPQLQTETGQLDAVIPEVQIRDLPIASGNPYALVITLPGVSQPDQRDNFTNGFGFSVNGLRPRSNNFLLDGFDNNDYAITGQALQPTNQEAVSTVTVLENAYAPEYGRGGSVENLTYKSGTNTFHGAAWEQYGGAALDAITAEQQASGLTKSPHQVNNLFGFTIGGPVVKNKLFLFGTDQWTRDIGAETFASSLNIPTAQGVATLQQVLAGAATGSVQANNTQILLNSLDGLVAPSGPNSTLVPLNDEPGCLGCSVQFDNVTRTNSGRSLSYEWTVRADYTASENDQIFARFTNTYSSLSPDLFANSAALPSQDTFQGGPARNFGVFWSHTFSPSVLNEVRFSQQTIAFNFAPLGSTLANPIANDPSVTFADSFGAGVVALGGFSQGGSFPEGRAHQTYQFQDDVSFVKGKHNIKVGTDLAILLVKDEIILNSVGTAVVTGGGTGCTFNGTPFPAATGCTDLANYIDGFTGTGGTANIQKQFGNPKVATPTNQQAYYFEDAWRMRPNFTLNYGVRYEYQPLDAENVLAYPAVNRNTVLNQPLQTADQVKPYRNAWGPRLGFAYSPHFWQSLFGQDKTVIRGSAGVFYDAFFTNISTNTAGNSPNTIGGTETPALGQPRGIPNFLTAIASIAPVVSPTNLVESVEDNLRNPRIYEWNLNVQRELPGKLIGQVAYVGTRGTGLFDNEQLNPGVFSGSPFNPVQRVNPNKGSIIVRGNRGDSIYHSLQADLKRNVGRLSLQASYTWSRLIDNASEVFTNSGGSSFWQNVFDPRSDRGPSAFNHTNVASFTWVYQLPGPSKGFLSPVFGGWQSAGSIVLQSGAPETLYFGGLDDNGDGQGNDRPSLLTRNAPINASATCLQTPSCVTGLGIVDPADLGPGMFDLLQAFFDPNATSLLPVTASQVRYVAIAGKNGDVGRNSIDLPGLEQVNLSVFKNFKMPYAEGHQLQIRADFFNAFNHFNAGQNNVVGYGNLLNPGAGFLAGNNVTLDGGRAIQIWLKYSF